MNRMLGLALVAVLWVSACSPARTRPDPVAMDAYLLRSGDLTPITAWSLEGRLAISDGVDGGSGRLSWSQDATRTELAFRAALGSNAWRIEADESSARLSLSSGETYVSDTLADLVRARVGWRVPVEALSWWMRGLAQPGDYESLQLDAQGRPESLDQLGWAVKFEGYRQFGSISLPVKLAARQGNYTVKLAVRSWNLPPGAGANG